MKDASQAAARRTRLLALLIAAALIAGIPCYLRLVEMRREAALEAEDWAACRQYLADLGRRPTGLPGSGSAAVPDLNRRIRDAAEAAGVQKNLSSVEPGIPRPIPNSAQSELPVYLRLEAMTLRDLCVFLARVGSDDPQSRVKGLELEPVAIEASGAAATGSAASSMERWTADVTLAYSVNTGAEVQAQ